MNEYGLIGFPLKHSFSQKFFSEKFDVEKIDSKYSNFEIPTINGIIEIISNNINLRGFNVTIPYKQAILSYLDDLSEEAKEIGAVNVVQIIRGQAGKNSDNYRLKGFNSDVYGFMHSLSPILKGAKPNALVLGTGGASKAVVYALKQLEICCQYVSREKRDGMITYDQIDQNIMKEYKLIVNCSPLGTFPDIECCPDIPYCYLTSEHILYDLVYNPNETLFLKKGKEKMATIKNGYEMLELQALEAWKMWNK